MASSSPQDRNRIEQLVFQCLDADDFEAALADVRRAHPELAARVQAALTQIQELTFADDSRASDLPLPRRIGPFELTERLGSGGMGVVYAARDLELGRDVALKLIRPDHLGVDDSRRRFRREVAAIARLQHPGIVAIHMAGEDQGVPYYSMELVAGRSLSERLREVRDRTLAKLSAADLLGATPTGSETSSSGSSTGSARVTTSWVDACVQVAREIAQALAHAHERGVFHRDVKPSNVLIDEHGRARLLDFGLARLQEGQELTQSTAQLGSLPYMPPEVLESRLDEYGAPQDVYSLGVTLYELLTLESPFLGSTAAETRRRIIAGQPRRPRALHPQISWEAETVCLAAMDLDQRRRYPTATAFADDLARVLARQPIAARRPGALLRGKRVVQRHPAWAVGVALGFTAFVVAPLLFAFYSQALRLDAENTARQLAARTTEFERLKHVVRLDDVRQSLDGLSDWPDDETQLRGWLRETWRPFAAELPSIEGAVADLEERGRSRSGDETLRFANPADQFLHQSLHGLLADARAFEEGAVAEIEDRLAWSERVEELTMHNPGAPVSWRDARAAIGSADGVTASELYGRDPPLQLTPQLGLVPIGMNPVTRLWEFYHLRSAEEPTVVPAHDPETGHIEVGEETGIIFVLVPGGRFAMGAQAEEPDGPNFDPRAKQHEGPVNDVTLDPFFVGRHELTQGQWVRLSRDDNPSVYGPGSWQFKVAQPVTLAHPVENVAWQDCTTLLQRHGLALPTEAQWEYACRAGSDTPWWTGADFATLQGAANIADATVARVGAQWPTTEKTLDDGFVVHATVSALRPNPFGLHHVLGNVMEWCADPTLLYAKAPCAPGTGLRGAGRTSKARTIRGGSCTSGPDLARSAFRAPHPATAADGYLGVRAARPLRRR